MTAPVVRAFTYPEVTATTGDGPQRDLSSIGLMQLELSAHAGSLTAPLSTVLGWKVGDVLELDRSAVDPVDLRIQGQLVGSGHMVIVDDETSVRVAEIVDGRAGLI